MTLGRPVSQLDPISGVTLDLPPDGPTMRRPDGRSWRLPMTTNVRLAPGGRSLYSVRYQPPTITMFDIEQGVDSAVHHELVGPSDITAPRPGGFVWEDVAHLLIPNDHVDAPGQPPSALRLDVRTGGVESAPLAVESLYQVYLIEPLISA